MITLQVLQFICVWTDNEFIQKSHLPGTLNQTTNLCLEDIKTLWCFLEMHYWIVLFFKTWLKFNYLNILFSCWIRCILCIGYWTTLFFWSQYTKIQIRNVVLAPKLIKRHWVSWSLANLMNVIDLANWIAQRNLSEKKNSY